MFVNTAKHLPLRVSIALVAFGLFTLPAAMAEDAETLQDCESCHLEQASEFHISVHYINRSGVQAGCNDCHRYQKHPEGMDAKAEVETPRIDLAKREWKRFAANDSKECKDCHKHMAMDLSKQEPRSVERHEESFGNDHTSCVDCHRGISHELPSDLKSVPRKTGLQP